MNRILSKLLALGFLLWFWSCQSGNQNSEKTDNVDSTKTTQSSTTAPQGDLVFNIDTSTSVINWIGRKTIGQHNGFVKLKEGIIYTSNGKVTNGSFVIDMNSITVSDLKGEKKMKLEKHLRSDDFFAVDKYSEATFTITNISADNKVKGKLTMRGVTKEIEFPAEISLSEKELKVKANFKINRQEWGVKYKGMKDHLIDDEVELTLDILAIPAQNAKPVEEKQPSS